MTLRFDRSSCVLCLAALMGLLCLALPGTALADSTYSYTGQPYNPNPPTFCIGTYVPVCSLIGVSGTVTFATPLADNLVNQFVAPLSFSFSGGSDAFLLTQATSLAIETFQFSTDASGNITAWGISLATNSASCSAKDMVCLGTYSSQTGASDYSGYDYNFGTPAEVYGAGQNLNAPGSWTLVSTPEPSSLLLFGAGLLGVLGVVRFQRRLL